MAVKWLVNCCLIDCIYSKHTLCECLFCSSHFGSHCVNCSLFLSFASLTNNKNASEQFRAMPLHRCLSLNKSDSNLKALISYRRESLAVFSEKCAGVISTLGNSAGEHLEGLEIGCYLDSGSARRAWIFSRLSRGAAERWGEGQLTSNPTRSGGGMRAGAKNGDGEDTTKSDDCSGGRFGFPLGAGRGRCSAAAAVRTVRVQRPKTSRGMNLEEFIFQTRLSVGKLDACLSSTRTEVATNRQFYFLDINEFNRG